MEESKGMFEPINRRTLHWEIVRQFQEKIISRQFNVGDKLPTERDIAAELNVNRATVREALKKMEVLGLIEIRHGNGIYVKDYLESGNLELFKEIIYMKDVVQIDVLRNILDIRKIIVPVMAGLAAENRTGEELAELQHIIVDEQMPMLEKDLNVHHLIARASRNLFYLFILNFFNQVFRDYGYLYFEVPENRERSKQFHNDILDAITRKDKSLAGKITADVLQYTEDAIYSYYRAVYGNEGGYS